MQERRIMNAERRSLFKRILTHIQQRCNTEIDLRKVDGILIACFFCSGLIDSVVTSIYGCFVMMQTGNTIFLAMGITSNPKSTTPFLWIRALAAISAFCLGILLFSSWHRRFGSVKRSVLMGSFFFQSCILVTSAFLVSAGVVSHSSEQTKIQHCDQASAKKHGACVPPWLDLLQISLLSFQSAGQVYISRALKQQLLPTVVLTAMYCDLVSGIPDMRKNGVLGDARQNVRAAGILSLFLGALVGGVLSRSWIGPAGVLSIAALLKASITYVWLIWTPSSSNEPKAELEIF